MKLAVATNDKKTICKDHFEVSRYYVVFEILNGEIISDGTNYNTVFNFKNDN